MYTITIGNSIVKRYKLQWKAYNGKRYYVKKTRILHSISLQDVKCKALSLFGCSPDNIIRI
ncbi:hypothetical protein LCGC14_0403890 [marine sediment metagenome]|uniref:Uncharacterized protein n=1 Tax=marine sediment metagenome TaxID=412755 RepID=A0A0F9SVW3_9ZZZZ